MSETKQRNDDPQHTVVMPRELTAENGAKHALSGEFIEWVLLPCTKCADCGEDDCCHLCNGEGVFSQPVKISWTTIKEIYAKAVEHLAA